MKVRRNGKKLMKDRENDMKFKFLKRKVEIKELKGRRNEQKWEKTLNEKENSMREKFEVTQTE